MEIQRVSIAKLSKLYHANAVNPALYLTVFPFYDVFTVGRCGSIGTRAGTAPAAAITLIHRLPDRHRHLL